MHINAKEVACQPCVDASSEYRRNHDQKKRDELGYNPKRLKNRGMSPEGYFMSLAVHDGMCWLCKEQPAKHIDHDHAVCSHEYDYQSCVKCFRGMLCVSCNSGLGHFKDNPELLQKAIDYLLEHKEFLEES